MAVYDEMKSAIEQGFYTLLDAQGLLNGYFMQLQITEDQYNELMDMAKKLNPNDSDDEEKIWKTQMKKQMDEMAAEIKAIKETMASSGTVVPDPVGAKGTPEDPIEAYRGAHYEKDKFYSDPEKGGEIYLCTVTVDLNGMPHEFVNVYFNWYSMPIQKPDTGTGMPDNTDQTETPAATEAKA